MDRKSELERAANPDENPQMDAARAIMDKNWTVLRALALGDQHPDIQVATLFEMAKLDHKRR